MNPRFHGLVLGLAILAACSDSGSGPSAGTADELSQAACDKLSTEATSVTSVLSADDAIADALVQVDVPNLITLAGPVSYVALEVPTLHTDYGIFAKPAGSVIATSTAALTEEHLDASCPEEGLGDLRLHIHEFAYSILTLEGDGEVWLYFGAAGEPGHGGEGGHGGEHAHGGEGGHGDEHAHGGEGGHGGHL
jgi:hypothetical protein